MKAPVDLSHSIEQLAPLPGTASHFIEAIVEGTSSLDELLGELRDMTALHDRVLELCNSATYELPRKTDDISHAVAYIGARTVIRIAVCEILSPYFSGTEVGGSRLALKEAWRHSVASGLAAQALAERAGVIEPDCAFVAGACHNLGRLVQIPRASTRIDALRQASAQPGRDILEIEREVLGFDHAEIGERLARHWNLPLRIRTAIRHHHHPELARSDEGLSALVHVGDVLAQQMGIGLGFEGMSAMLNPAATEPLELGQDDYDEIRLTLLDDLWRSRDLLTPTGAKES